MSHWRKSKRQRRFRAQIHPSNQSPLQWVFATPFSVFIATFGWNSALNSSVASVPAAHRSFAASCLFNSLLPSSICRLCILISSSVEGIENKIAQSQNQSAKLATRKHIMNASCSGEDAYARSKRKLQKKVCSQPSQKEPHKAKLFQEASFRKEALLHCTRCSQTSLYGMRYP